MNSFKTLFLLFLFLLGLQSQAAVIGYGYSYVMTDRQEFVYMGFLMGLRKNLKMNFPEDYLYLKKSTDKNMMEPFHIAKELEQKAGPFIVGFPTSHEALMAAKTINNKKMIFISAVAKSSELGKLGDNIFSINSSNEDTISVSIDLIKKTLKLTNGVMITNPHNTFSINLDKLYRSELINHSKLNIDSIFTDKNGNLKLKQEDRNLLKKAQFIIINTYIRRSFGTLEGLRKIGKTVPLITNSSWVIDDIQEVRRLVTDESLQVYSFEVINRNTPQFKEITKMAKSEYGMTPNPHLIYGYDLGVVVAELINRVKGTPTYQNIMIEIKKNSCFKNTSSGSLCFPKSGGNAIREVFVVKFNKEKGFIKVGQ